MAEPRYVDQLNQKFFEGALSPAFMDGLSALPTDRPDVRLFIERMCRLLLEAGGNARDLTALHGEVFGSLLSRILPGAWEGRVPPITLAGRHRTIDQYVGSNKWLSCVEGGNLLDLGCGFPPHTRSRPRNTSATAASGRSHLARRRLMSALRRARRIPASSATSVTWSTSTSPPPLSQSGFRAEQRIPGATRPRPSAGNTPGAVAASGVLAAGLPGPLGTPARPGNDLSPAALSAPGHLAGPDPPPNSPGSPPARLRSRPAPAPQAVPPPGPKINAPISQALELAHAMTPDLVVKDVEMPGMNGIEATRRIVSELPNIKVIALSIHADKRLVAQVLQAGASEYVLKDCAFELLAGAIRAAAANEP